MFSFSLRSSRHSNASVKARRPRVRLTPWTAAYLPRPRAWVALVSLGAFLGMQAFPGVMTLQQVQAQENNLTQRKRAAGAVQAAERAKVERASSFIEAARRQQQTDERVSQRARVKASDPTGCPPGDCEVSPKALDLSHVPNEKELRRAGGMGGALSPIGNADVPVYEKKANNWMRSQGVSPDLAATADPESVPGEMHKRKVERIQLLKDINLSFGQAMNEWNSHHYGKAAEMLRKHIKDFPESPWAGEAGLHLGCDAKYNGRFTEAEQIYGELIDQTDDSKDSKSFDIHEKAKLRFADLNIATGKLDDAASQLQDLMKSDTDWRRRTWAVHWIRMVGAYKSNSRTLRACGTKALGFMLASLGQKADAAGVEVMQPKRENGFTLAELQSIGAKHHLQLRGFRGDAGALASLPMPAILHYDFDSSRVKSAPLALRLISAPKKSVLQRRSVSPFQLDHRAGHFLVAQNVDTRARRVGLYDPQERRHYSLSFAQLDREWSGTGLVRAVSAGNAQTRMKMVSVKTGRRIAWLSLSEMRRVVGGCCGVARTPADLGPNGPQPPDCGSPTWSVNPINLNLHLSDTPLWYHSAIGPSMQLTLHYNAEDSTNQNSVFGNKWAWNYGSYLVEDTAAGGGQVTIFTCSSRQDNFIPDGKGNYSNPVGDFSRLRKLTATRYELSEPGGQTYVYDVPAGTGSLQSYLVSIRDQWGNALSFGYNTQVQLTTITDALGRVTRLSYDDYNHVVRAVDPFGRFVTFAYDTWGNLIEAIDTEGSAVQYTYDKDIFLTQVNTSLGAWSFYWQLPGRDFTAPALDQYFYVTITNPMNKSFKYGYDGGFGGTRDKTWFENSASRRTTFTVGVMPDGKGRVVGVLYPNSESQTTPFDPATGQTSSTSDQSGAGSSFTYNEQGLIASITDARGFTTRCIYAPNGLDLLGTIDATGRRSGTAAYNDRHQLLSYTDVEGSSVSASYTSWGAPKTLTYPDNSVVTYNYDESAGSPTRGQVLSVTRDGIVLSSATYDVQGRVTSKTGIDGKTVTYEYNDLDHLTKATLPDGSSSQTDYSCCGVASVQTARNGQKTFYDYDALKRLARVQDAQGNTVSYDYNDDGQLRSLKDSKGNVTSWQYDTIGRVIAKQMSDGSVERYGYDAANRTLSSVDAKGRVTKMFYDANGNMIRLDRPGTANDVTAVYYELNRPARMRDALGISTFGYDNLNRVTMIDGPWDNDTLTYHYDKMGRRDWMKINGIDQVSYGYDALKRMSAIAGGAGTFLFNYVGNTSRLNTISKPNGSTTGYAYDSLNRLTGIQNLTSTGALLSRYNYGFETTGYEKRSVRTSMDSQVGTNPLEHVGYTYDVVGQLQSEVSAQTPTPSLKKTYSFDAMGNRTAQTNDAGTPNAINVSWSSNALNQLGAMTSTPASGPITQTALSYDETGNLTQQRASQNGATTGTTQYAYTDQDQLASTVGYSGTGVAGRRTDYVYDGVGRKRIARELQWNTTTSAWDTLSEKRYIMDGMDVIQERDGTNTVTTNYLRAGNIGGLLAKSRRVAGQADTHFYYHYDGSGNVCQLTDVGQNTVAAYSYDAWGNLRSKSGAEADNNLYRFATKEVQSNGLIDFGLRFYSPGLGRFINRDPSAEAGGLNLYAFAANSPTNKTDAYGLSIKSFGEGFAIGAGIGIAGAFVVGGLALACPAFGAFLAAYGTLLGAAGVIMAYKQYYDIMNSNKCPDVKDYEVGELCGGIVGGFVGGGLAGKFLPKAGPLPGPEGEPPPVSPEPAPSEPKPEPPDPTRCFVAGTKITMADGTLKAIEQVKKGDKVLSRDQNGGKVVVKTVAQTFVHHVLTTRLLTLQSGEQIETTPSHRFFVADTGWQKAKEFGLGTSIVTRAGPAVALTHVEDKHHQTPVAVYNFEVEGTHTYFVGHTELWAHNDKINPLNVKFGQRGVTWRFQDGGTIGDLVEQLKAGGADAPAIEVIISKGGNYVTLDNRRLMAYRLAGKDIPFNLVDTDDLVEEDLKKLDFPEGHDEPYIRGGPASEEPVLPEC